MLMLILLLIAVGCAAAFFRWRWGVCAAILIGLVQDPLRKMVPGVPGYLTMISLPLWMMTIASAVMRGELRIRAFLSAFPRLSRWVLIFGLYLLIPAGLSASYGQNSWQITVLGAMAYLTSFLVLAAGWQFARDSGSALRFFSFYALCAAVLMIGGPLDYFGLSEQLAVVGTEAMGHVWVTYRTGEAVYMYAGFFRGPDVMGWHAALLTMIASLMAVRSRGWVRWFWFALSIWGLLNIWICGRRKMISMLPVFWGLFLLLTSRFRDMKRLVLLAGTLLLLIGAGWYSISRTYNATAVDTFYMTTLDQWDESLKQHGLDSMITTVNQAGFWGYGLGMGQQGLHHIQAEKPNVWQESGSSKLIAELGVPGTVLFLVLAGVFFLTAYHVVGLNASTDSFYASAGLFSILVANIASAVVSAQVFGDPFIMLLLSFLAGILLSGAHKVYTNEVPELSGVEE